MFVCSSGVDRALLSVPGSLYQPVPAVRYVGYDDDKSLDPVGDAPEELPQCVDFCGVRVRVHDSCEPNVGDEKVGAVELFPSVE